MAGIISPSMPLFVVENRSNGQRSHSNFNEGLGKVLRFGANGPEVIARLRTMASVVAPALRAALAKSGPIELKPLMSQALNMGDEVHNRNAAATALFFKRIAPALLEADVPRDDAAATLAFIAGNDHFFLNLSMAACKSSARSLPENADLSRLTFIINSAAAELMEWESIFSSRPASHCRLVCKSRKLGQCMTAVSA